MFHLRHVYGRNYIGSDRIGQCKRLFTAVYGRRNVGPGNRTILITTENNNQKRNLDEHEHEQILLNNKKQRNLNNSTANNESEIVSNNLSLISSAPSTEKSILLKSNIKKDLKNNNWNTNSSNTNPSLNVSTTEQQLTWRTPNQLGVYRTNLTEAEKKTIHNRRCTIKQRQRCYRYELIRRDIDNRFSITKIKQILKQLNISFNLLNKSTSSITNKTTLYIGIKDPDQMDIYERVTSKLFSTDHYHEFIRAQRRTQHRHEDRYNDQRELKHGIKHQHDQRRNERK